MNLETILKYVSTDEEVDMEKLLRILFDEETCKYTYEQIKDT